MVAYSDLTALGDKGIILTVEGSEYAFGGPGVASVSWTSGRDDDWPTSAVEPIILSGFLVCGSYPTSRGAESASIAWSERINPQEGDLEAEGIGFRIHDAVPSSGAAAGFNVVTYLASRTTLLTSTALAVTCSASATSLTVADDSVFPAAPFTIWVDREAIRISAKAGSGVLTVDGGTAGRGVLGTKKRAHTVVAADGYYPEVYSSFPFAARRGVVLWVGNLSGAGVLTDPVPVWRGHVAASPRLAADGCTYELACDHRWGRVGNVPVGIPAEVCRLVGYRSETTGPWDDALLYARVTVTTGGGTTTFQAATPAGVFYQDLIAVCSAFQNAMYTAMNAAGLAGTIDPVPMGRTHVQLTVRVTGATSGSMVLRSLGREVTTPTIPGTAPVPLVAAVEVGEVAAPLAGSATDNFVTPTTFRVDRVGHLPSTWGAYDSADGSRAYASVAVFVSAGQSEEQRARIVPQPADIDGNTVVNTTNSTIRGAFEFYVPGAGAIADGADTTAGGLVHGGSRGRFVVKTMPFGLVVTVTTSEWTYGVEQGLIGDQILAGGPSELDVDSRDWTWDRVQRIWRTTLPGLRSRTWLCNGEQILKDLIVEACQFSGAAPALRRSRIALDAIRPPLMSDVFDAAHTLTTTDLVGRAGWQQNADGVVNRLDCEIAEGGTTYRYVLQDRRSAARYGAGRTLEIKPRGLTVGEAIRNDPEYLKDHLLSHIAALWGEPTEVLHVTVPASRLDTVYLLDSVKVTEWLAPNNAGGRGWSARTGVVIGRDVALAGGEDAGTIGLEVLAWPQYTRTSGWAPAARVASIAGAVLTLASGYAFDYSGAQTTDYAGSNLTGYADATRGTVASDKGAGFFTTTSIGASGKVRLVERDNTAPRAPDAFTISSVDTGAGTITLTAAPDAAWQTIITNGGKVDVTFDTYSGTTTGQRVWPFVSARATRLVESSAAPYVWAP